MAGCAGKSVPKPVAGETAPAVAGSVRRAPLEFQGIAWGARIRDMDGMRMTVESPSLRTRTFARADVAPAFLDRPVKKILYDVFDDAFYQAWIEFDGKPLYDAFLAELTAKYGAPDDADETKFYNAWFLGDVNVYCVFHLAEQSGDVSFWYQPIYAEKEILLKKMREQAKAEKQAGLADNPEAPK